MKASKGFTLLELLIALSIFSLIGVASYAMLRTVTDSSITMKAESKKLRNLEHGFWLIHQDISQIANRPILDENGAQHLALEYNSASNIIEFTKAGWRNSFGYKRSELQRVRYELKNKQLWRYYWAELDRSPDSSPASQLLLNDVVSLNFRFLDKNNIWQTDWHGTNLPAAIEADIKTSNFADLREIMEVAKP